MALSDSNPRHFRNTATEETTFAEIVQLIAASQEKAVRAANTVLIDLYFKVGEIISEKIASSEWGDGVVRQLAEYIARTRPGLRGFTRANLFRMRQFYETYRDDEKVAPLVRQLAWSHHLLILAQSKRKEEREFYLQTAIREGWSKREWNDNWTAPRLHGSSSARQKSHQRCDNSIPKR